VLRAQPSCRLLIIGQAPGSKVHETGIPWDDESGRRLRDWLALAPPQFYDDRQIAIIPTGLCYPGRDAKGGDRPPRPECAPLWHPLLLPHLKNLGLTLLVGGYAHQQALGARAAGGVSVVVRRWRDFLPEFLVLPHPSWRTRHWQTANPWFDQELLPEARRLIAGLGLT
jgi:uracil-DNA glycosylase